MEDLKGINLFPHFHNFTASSNMTEIVLPDSAKKISIGSNVQALYIAQNGASDGGSVPTNKAFIPKSNYLPIAMGRGYNRSNSLFVATQTGSAEVSIILEEE